MTFASPSLLALPFLLLASGTAMAEDSLMDAVRDSARILGAAQYCDAPEDMTDEYIARAEGGFARLAKDDFEKHMARIEFKNLSAAASAKAPSDGCDAFLSRFETMLKSPS
ncbi:hypothetical protein [Gimibacter soli]|uniref:Uncharacterized protein n=1 Tax=Gimibacter soli TaxID=3024400 RepID=A0AAE9XSV2_9PROT|nr:hypothetical protein [Gimibacter soli]WCL55721.1 hypothetical protein PH603_08125 [Gimibacter soli]